MDDAYWSKFMARVDLRDGHWIWAAQIVPSRGHRLPIFQVGGVKRSARQVAWEHEHGPGATRLIVTCDKPLCVRPEHLFDNVSPRREDNKRIYRERILTGPVKQPAADVTAHLRWLVDECDQSLLGLAQRAPASISTIKAYYTGEWTSTKPAMRAKLLALRPVAPKNVWSGRRADTTGTVRRLRALTADGFCGTWLSQQLGHMDTKTVSGMIRGRSQMVAPSMRKAVAELYAKLEGVEAADVILDPGSIKRTKSWARKGNYVPRHCWDTDTIDNPKANPEWTGRCGKVEGYRIHLREGIPVCDPCRNAFGNPTGCPPILLPDIDIETIMQRHRDGDSARIIALDYPVSFSTINRIIKEQLIREQKEDPS